MSGPSTMTCERCSELITELVCGELDGAAAETVRAHAASCTACGRELRSFERVLRVAGELTLETPSAAVEQRIMQAARDGLTRGATQARAERDERGSEGGFRAWLERLATWAMSPQVAMASVLLLVVGIGLYALPFGHESSAPESLHLAQEPTPAAATAASAPVAEEQASADEHVENARSREAMASETSARRERAEGSAAQPLKQEAPAKKLKSARAQLARPGEMASGGASAAKPAARAGKGSGAALDDAFAHDLGRIGGGEARSTGGYAPPPPAPAPSVVSEQAAGQAPADAANASPSVGATRQAPATPASEPAYAREAELGAAKSDASQSATVLAEGIRAAQAGQHARAVALLEPLARGTSPERASARMWVARSLRELGQCERALVYYAGLVSAKSASPSTLNEAADCYEQTGDPAQAASLRARASSAKTAPKQTAPAGGQ